MTPPPQPTKNSVETLKASRFSLDHEFRAARSSLADRLHVFREHGSERPVISKSNAPSQPRNWGYAARDVSIVSYVVFRILSTCEPVVKELQGSETCGPCCRSAP